MGIEVTDERLFNAERDQLRARVAELEAEVVALTVDRNLWKSAKEAVEFDVDLEYHRAEALEAERDRLRDACNTARLAFAGYVSVGTAIRKLDDLGEAGQ